MIGCTVIPGVRISAQIIEIPSCLRSHFSVRTRQKIQSAQCAPDVQIFVPSRM